MTNKLYLFALIALLSGCVPVNSTVHLSPNWSGTIIDASSLQPIEAVHIQNVLSWEKYETPRKGQVNEHAELEYFTGVDTAMSDSEGRFELSAVTSDMVEFRLPVTGMMYTRSVLSLKADGYDEDLIFDQNMRYGELDMNINKLGYIALDAAPETLAAMPFGMAYMDIRDIKSMTQNCNGNMWELAARKLNTARKVLQASGWTDVSKREAMPTQIIDIINSVYEKTGAYWRLAKQSCKSTAPKDTAKIKNILDKLAAERSLILNIK